MTRDDDLAAGAPCNPSELAVLREARELCEHRGAVAMYSTSVGMKLDGEPGSTDLARLRRVEAAARGVIDEIGGALAEAELMASGRKGMQVPYFGAFAAVLHLPSVARDLRRLSAALRSALEEK